MIISERFAVSSNLSSISDGIRLGILSIVSPPCLSTPGHIVSLDVIQLSES